VSNTFCVVLCFVFRRLVYPMLPVFLDCPFLICPSNLGVWFVEFTSLNHGRLCDYYIIFTQAGIGFFSVTTRFTSSEYTFDIFILLYLCNLINQNVLRRVHVLITLAMFVCMRVHVLITLAMFVYIKWCPTHFVLCFVLFFVVLCTLCCLFFWLN
jgi:hypothetical protein